MIFPMTTTPASLPCRRRSQRGFTIIEVTMTTFIMAMAMSTSILTLMSGFKSIDVARNLTLSSQVLQSEMERLRLMSWTEIASLSPTETVDLGTVFTSDSQLAARFTLVRQIGDVSGKVGEMKQITLAVSWTNATGRSLSRQFTTYYAKDGLYDYYYTLARS